MKTEPVTRIKSPLKRAEQFWGYLFVAPQFIGIIAFTLFPTLAALILTTMKWTFVKPPVFVGLTNIKTVINDPLTLKIIINTLIFVLGNVPLTIILSTMIAILLNSRIRGLIFFRTVFFLPAITSAIAVALVWSWLLMPEIGLINVVLSLVGIRGPAWLADPKWAMPSVILVTLWQWTGYNAVILFAGLKHIPSSYAEAASIDGANSFQVFFRITLPMLTPTLFFLMTILTLNAINLFSEPFMMTNGGPADATKTFVLQIYLTAFQFFNMGSAAVLALILFILSLIVTLLQFSLQKGWVNYDV